LSDWLAAAVAVAVAPSHKNPNGSNKKEILSHCQKIPASFFINI
jgi:hypothetical protein